MSCTLILALLALAVPSTVFATDYNVEILKDQSSEASMANESINGPATVEQLANGNYKITIPLKPAIIEKMWIKFKGYVIDFDVENAISTYVSPAPYTTPDAEMSFEVAQLPSDMKFDITYDVAIYWPSGNFFTNHSNFPGTPDVLAADLILTQ